MKKTNSFQNINIKEAEISLQQISGNTVISKKKGRPQRPNMKKYLIKLDTVLNTQVTDEAAKLGTSRSFVISQALRQYFAKKQ